MRILLCLASAAGGIGTHVADLAGSLSAAGHDVHVATDPATRGRFDLPGDAMLTVGEVRAFGRGADVVHAHGFRAGLVATTAMATLAPFGAGVPVVVSLHNPIRGSGSSPRRVVGEAAARGVVRRAALVTGASSDLVADARALGALRPPAPPFDASRPIAAANRLFAAIVCSAGNQVLWDAFQKVSGQLDLVRRHETVLFDDLGDEALGLYAAYSEEIAPGFVATVGRYHDRRIGAAGALAALVFGCAGAPVAAAVEERE